MAKEGSYLPLFTVFANSSWTFANCSLFVYQNLTDDVTCSRTHLFVNSLFMFVYLKKKLNKHQTLHKNKLVSELQKVDFKERWGPVGATLAGAQRRRILPLWLCKVRGRWGESPGYSAAEGCHWKLLWFHFLKGRLPPFFHKTVFTRAEPPMSQTEVGFPKFEPVCEKSETKVQFDAIFLVQENRHLYCLSITLKHEFSYLLVNICQNFDCFEIREEFWSVKIKVKLIYSVVHFFQKSVGNGV